MYYRILMVLLLLFSFPLVSSTAITFSSNAIETINLETFNYNTTLLSYCDETADKIEVKIIDISNDVAASLGTSDELESTTSCFRDNQVESAVINSTAFVYVLHDVTCDTIFCGSADDEVRIGMKNNFYYDIIPSENLTFQNMRGSYSVSIATFNESNFVVGWYDATLDDIIVQLWSHNGTSFINNSDQITVDSNAGVSSQGLSIEAFNETAYVVCYFDDSVDDIYCRNYDGSSFISQQTATSNSGNSDAVWTTVIDDEEYSVSWFNNLGGFESIYSRSFHVNGTFGFTSLVEVVGPNVYTVSSALIDEDSIVIGYYDNTGIGYYSKNEIINAVTGSTEFTGNLYTFGTSSDVYQHVSGYTYRTNQFLPAKPCDDNYAHAYRKTSSDSAFNWVNSSISDVSQCDYCTYNLGQGNWNIPCQENCTVQNNQDIDGNDIYLRGSGSFETAFNISDWNYLYTERTCYVKTDRSGGFKW